MPTKTSSFFWPFFFVFDLLHRRCQGSSALAVESRAAPTTVHELQPHQSVTSSSSAVTNKRVVTTAVVRKAAGAVDKNSSSTGAGGSSEYQLQFAWPTVHKSIKRMPESLDGVFQSHHPIQNIPNNNNNSNGNYSLNHYYLY